ncbi:MAG TPA: GTP-binding protein, partial [Novosphingobium sp.]|nr:GTP-binding protein [Novosphingobium sp.]
MTQRDLTPLPVHVLTGFLGAGKTTLLNALLRAPGLADTAVIVNEFGEIGLDHLLVGSARDTVVLLDSGCLCCAMEGSLRETLANLYARRAAGDIPKFHRVLIETSGLAEPAPILETLLADPVLAGFYAPGALLCVVDALHGMATLDQSGTARAQAALADTILISKADLAGGLAPALLTRLTALNHEARVIDGAAALGDPLALLR